jgi:hypothetical protein
MNVDNLVERRACAGVNSAKFNTMIRIAQFWCNTPERVPKEGKISARRDKDHGVVGRKAQTLWLGNLKIGNFLQRIGWEERTTVEQSRETFWPASSADFNTTSGGGQDEF